MPTATPARTLDGRPRGPRTCRAWTPAESVFSFTATRFTDLETPATGTEQTDRDTIFDALTGATTLTEANVAADVAAAYSSLDPSIATVDAAGRVRRVTNGTARILAKTAKTTRRVDVAVNRTVGATTRTFNRYVAGTVAHAAYHAIRDRVDGLTASNATKKLLASADYTAKAWTRSPTCWADGLDLTCFPVGNTYQDRQNALLISADCVQVANHYQIPTGTKLYYLAADGTVYERTVVNGARYTSYGDVFFQRLNSPLPAAIKPALYLPANWRAYLPNIFSGDPTEYTKPLCPIPILWIDGERKALIHEWYKTVADTVAANWSQHSTRRSDNATLASFDEDGTGGDSNGAQGLHVANRFIFLGLTAETTSGLESDLAGVNAHLDALGATSHAAAADFSAFTAF